MLRCAQPGKNQGHDPDAVEGEEFGPRPLGSTVPPLPESKDGFILGLSSMPAAFAAVGEGNGLLSGCG
jgi:hypothetical protein